ncbi:MAG: toll/interleukin-1 receptor domain-containing protein, partial [Anaerolineae bacterium]|nr:toll/interleukin-1 receptor domain-containing protein [Anaerolineae bacterium]
MPRIYVSYRRSDHPAMAGRIADRLSQVFGRSNVATDVDDPPPGMKFATHIENALRAVDGVLVIMGERWATSANQYGFSELFDTGDFVRLEIEAALKLNKIVVPVLVNKAAMPTKLYLPATLAPLLEKQPMRVRDSAEFDADMDAL